MTDGRKEFEAWFRKEHPNGWPLARFNGSGQYAHMHPADNWIVWQAARRAALEDAAKVCEEYANALHLVAGDEEGLAVIHCADAIRALAAQTGQEGKC